MAATVTLTVNVEQAKAALNQVNGAITQIKLNGSQITIGGQKVSQEMGDVAKQTEKVTSSTKDLSKETQKTGGALKQMFKGVTKEGKEAVRGVKDFANGLFSVWSAVIIAVEVAAKTFAYFWSNLTENIEKLTVRGQTAIKVAERHQKQVDKQTDSAKQLIKQLQDLNKVQNKTIDEQRLAQSIAIRLNKMYKDLGVTLNEVTGKYQNLYEAEIKIDNIRRRSQNNTLNAEIQAQKDVANAALVKTFGRGIQLDKQVNGKDFFGIAEALGGTMGYQNADLLAKQWNTGDLQKQIKVLESLIGGLSSSEQVVKNSPEALAALQTLQDYQRQLKELNSVESLISAANKRLADSFKNTREAIEKSKQSVEELKKTYEENEKKQKFNSLTNEQQVTSLQDEIKLLNQKNEELEKSRKFQETGANDVGASAQEWRAILDADQARARQLEDTLKKGRCKEI